MKTVKIVLAHEKAKMPEKQTDGAAGYDLFAAEQVTIAPYRVVPVNCGFKMELPKGHEAQIRTRSGMAAREQMIVANSPGTIDEDYRGYVKVLLLNSSPCTYTVIPGDRIAQMVIKKVDKFKFKQVEKLSETDRAEGGFGSTGK